MPQKKKKLSLEEARALFLDKSELKKRKYSKKSSKSYKKSYPVNKDQVKKRIEQLERKIMEGNLEEKEETRILNEIEKLEKSIN